MICPVCSTTTEELFHIVKYEIPYWKCSNCDLVFCKPIPKNIILTDNNSPEERNNNSLYSTRLKRMLNECKNIQTVLDFGCGTGQFVEFLKLKNINAVGIDQNTKLTLNNIDMKVDTVTMVESIEHLYDPIPIIEKLYQLLNVNGIFYIESSFVDFLDNLKYCSYVDPRIGHCSINSVKSIKYIANKFNMKIKWINNNVVILKK